MKEVIEVILENIQYVYPGFIALSFYEYITIGSDSEDTERFFLKIVCISYIMVKIVTPYLVKEGVKNLVSIENEIL